METMQRSTGGLELSSKGNIYITPLAAMAQGTLQKRRHKDCKGQNISKFAVRQSVSEMTAKTDLDNSPTNRYDDIEEGNCHTVPRLDIDLQLKDEC